jgi:hypothetical protein
MNTDHAALEKLLQLFLDDPATAHAAIFEHRHPQKTPSFHLDIIRLYWSDDPQCSVIAFRGGGKLTLIEEMILLGALLGKFRYAVIVCSSEKLASDRLLSIKYELETNDSILSIWGQQKGSVWQQGRIILANNACIDAIGASSDLRGIKYLSDRPQMLVADDLEEHSSYNDNVSTHDRREALSRWFHGTLMQSLASGARVRVIGSNLHPESLIARTVISEHWRNITIPVETVGPDGERVASWPDPNKFPLETIDKKRRQLEEAGQLQIFEQEFMCRALDPESQPFKESMFRFEMRTRTWEQVYIIYDPARTAGPGRSCATGKVVASWIGGKLLIWEATQAFWMPAEIIDDIFASDDEWNPLEIGVEVTGLNQFIEQPLRLEQSKRGHRLPLHALNPPKGPGKENFLLRLQPVFAAGEAVFCGERQQFRKLIDELLGFPYGLKDTINALAYMAGLHVRDQTRGTGLFAVQKCPCDRWVSAIARAADVSAAPQRHRRLVGCHPGRDWRPEAPRPRRLV